MRKICMSGSVGASGEQFPGATRPEIQPAWRSYIENFQDKFRIGTLVYGDYRYYTLGQGTMAGIRLT
jgi:hypothetical protein